MAEVTFHGDNRGAAKNDGAFRGLARKFEVHAELLDGLVLFLEFLWLLFGLLVFFSFVLLLCVGRGSVFLIGFGLCFSLCVVFLFAFFLLFLGRLEGDGGERLAEKARTDSPGDGFTVACPGKIVGAN